MELLSIDPHRITYEEIILIYKEGRIRSPSNKEFKNYLIELESAMLKANYKLSLNIITLLICSDPEKTFKEIRKKGVFRYSKYIEGKNIIPELVERLLSICSEINYINDINISYLNSIQNLKVLIPAYKSINQKILSQINFFKRKYRKYSLSQTLSAFLDYLFWADYFPSESNLKSSFYNDILTKEEISSAVSFLIFKLTEIECSRKIKHPMISDLYITRSEIKKIIEPACTLEAFKEFEIQVDHFDYRCIDLENGVKKLIPPNIDFEKSLRLGYIRNQTQTLNDAYIVEKAPSFDEIMNEICVKLNFFEYTESHSYPRFRVVMPIPALEYLIENYLTTNHFFQEELFYLAGIFKEQLMTFEKFENTIIKDELTLIEFFKILRFFKMFQIMASSQFEKHPKSSIQVNLRSLIPVMEENYLFNITKSLTSEEKLITFLDLMCWTPGDDGIFDIQYKPIIFLDGHYYIANSILSTSNSIRNLYASQYKANNPNLFSDGQIDPVVLKLKETFDEVGIISFPEVKYPGGDIDLLVIHNSSLYFFECKQSLNPTGIHDLRTLYDYVRKAEDQLDKVINRFHDGNLRREIETTCQINLDSITKVFPGIILSSRLFNGDSFKYPVRCIHECVNVIKNGTIRISDRVYSIWKNQHLSEEDLNEYFSHGQKLFKHIFDNFLFREVYYHIDNNIVISYDQFYIDLKTSVDILLEFAQNEYREINNSDK